VRMFTVEKPYPLYRSFNNPFHDKVKPARPLTPILRSSILRPPPLPPPFPLPLP
jgi:hypothetical protein